jgi:protein MpaA
MALELALSVLALAVPGPTRSAEVIGHSTQGRPIRAYRLGNPLAGHRVLVVGCIHGNEDAGVAITRRLVHRTAPTQFDLWVVNVVNPDGRRLRVRQNGRGVDLNRNFGSEWIPIGTRWDPEYSGPHPWSEPETRAVRALVKRIHPELTVWYHQPQDIVRAWGQSVPAARHYARFAGMGFRKIRWPHGTAPNWQNHRFPGTTSFVVELPASGITTAAAARNAKAVVRLERALIAGG